MQRDLPRGGYTTIGGLVMAELGRLPEPGDTVTVAVPAPPDDPDGRPAALAVTVRAVRRRVPEQLELRWTEPGRDDGRSGHDRPELDGRHRHRGRSGRAERVLRGHRVRAGRGPPAPAGGRRGDQRRRARRAAQLAGTCRCCWPAPSWASRCARSAWVRWPSRPCTTCWRPLFETWGLPATAADVLAFVLALLVVTFLHLVVGEMAPEVVGDRAPGALGDPAGAADARLPVADPPAAARAQRAGQRAAAAGRRAAGRRGRGRPQPGDAARARRPLGRGRRPGPRSGATSCSPRWSWTRPRCAPWSGRPPRSAAWPAPTPRVEVRTATRRTGHLRHVVWRGADAGRRRARAGHAGRARTGRPRPT